MPQKKRCPNGTRKNKKTGECDKREENDGKSKATQQTENTEMRPTTYAMVDNAVSKRKKCPNGTRRNKKTGLCEDKDTKHKEREARKVDKERIKDEKREAKRKERETRKVKKQKLTPTPEPSLTPESSPTPESSLTPESSPTPESIPTPESSPTPEPIPTPESSPTPELKLSTSDTEFYRKLNSYKKKIEIETKMLEEQQQRNIANLSINTKYDFLYPHQDDPFFNEKLMRKKEFYDIMYTKEEKDVEEFSEKMCNQQLFELLPHQLFVRNFLSFNTPYNSLLLFHGLGTGKTCSAITVTEMMRTYMNQLGINKHIIIVASPNVQTNFRMQLFNENKLELINGLWNLDACTGNKFLKEINPINMRGLSKEQVIKLIKRIIKQNYYFMGAEQFANYINKITSRYEDKKSKIKHLQDVFSDRMIVIDEVHNIRNISDKPTKKISTELLYLVSNVDNLKLLLLTATPMFNTSDEIIWLLNLMNANDRRPLLKITDVFDSNGELKVNTETGENIGEQLLIQKSRSYVSYLRGENPYTFPFKITPSMFMSENTLSDYIKPIVQLNGKEIVKHLKFPDVCITNISEYQHKLYSKVTQSIKRIIPDMNTGLGYQHLSLPIQGLTITYPSEDFDKSLINGTEFDYKKMVGKVGLHRVMKYKKSTKRQFEYKQSVREMYGRIFHTDVLSKYSAKFSFICNKILNSEGIVLVYSQYIDGGCLPFALALEELGFSRYGNDNLFRVKPTEQIDALTFKNTDVKHKATYAMITGDGLLSGSSNNETEIKALINKDNINGEKIKVVIISEAGSEGIDLSYIRQVHIIDPWYNLGRIEQIVGRAVRNCSHKLLPFEKRNVEIYLHATQLIDKEEEAVDMYMYRLAEYKAIKIGKITRILKENAIDCIVNKNIALLNQEKLITLSSNNIKINHTIGDKPFTYVCDYMDNCKYECNFNKSLIKDISYETYDDTYITLNVDIIINKIKELFKEGYCYKKDDIVKRLTHIKSYPRIQINSALSRLVNDNSEFIFDYYNNRGRVINIGKYYLFNPIQITSKHIPSHERNITRKTTSKKRIRIKLDENRTQKKIEISKMLKKCNRELEKTYKSHIDVTSMEKEIDWYKVAGTFYEKNTKNNIIDIDRKTYNIFVVKHMFAIMEYDTKIILLNYIFNNTPESDFEKILHTIVTNEMLILSKYIIIGNYKTDTNDYYTLQKDGNSNIYLVESKDTERREIGKDIIPKNRKMSSMLNTTIGFMGNFRKKSIVFKIKNTTKKETGFKPEQKGRAKLRKMLNDILKITNTNYVYNNATTKYISNSRELVIDLEILYRYYDYKNINEKHWFLSYEEILINKYFQSK